MPATRPGINGSANTGERASRLWAISLTAAVDSPATGSPAVVATWETGGERVEGTRGSQ
ncbi:MAG: hypothetical protein HRT86_11490 [Ilumatobacteraceae bacterium]|nr:hypothetical protein [Ilumatobacteraceae bacterium]